MHKHETCPIQQFKISRKKKKQLVQKHANMEQVGQGHCASILGVMSWAYMAMSVIGSLILSDLHTHKKHSTCNPREQCIQSYWDILLT